MSSYLPQDVHRILYHDPELHTGRTDNLLRDGIHDVHLAGDGVIQLADLLLQQLLLVVAEEQVCIASEILNQKLLYHTYMTTVIVFISYGRRS